MFQVDMRAPELATCTYSLLTVPPLTHRACFLHGLFTYRNIDSAFGRRLAGHASAALAPAVTVTTPLLLAPQPPTHKDLIPQLGGLLQPQHTIIYFFFTSFITILKDSP